MSGMIDFLLLVREFSCAATGAYGRAGEHHPQMKGNYTPGAAIVLPLSGEHHPQMKGNYTLDLVQYVLEPGEHHPQMKGNYTPVRKTLLAHLENTIPK